MATLEEQFLQAKADVQGLNQKPGNDVLLKLYGLYKQGTEGDVSLEKPGVFDFVAKAKYNAWEQLKGISTEEAQQQYITLVKDLLTADQPE
ncbi:MAG: acyl-CoA-binding protein [Bacteroidota bacterium]